MPPSGLPTLAASGRTLWLADRSRLLGGSGWCTQNRSGASPWPGWSLRLPAVTARTSCSGTPRQAAALMNIAAITSQRAFAAPDAHSHWRPPHAVNRAVTTSKPAMRRTAGSASVPCWVGQTSWAWVVLSSSEHIMGERPTPQSRTPPRRRRQCKLHEQPPRAPG